MGWKDDVDYELKDGDFAWCLHCERVFIWTDQLECPYEDCDGHFWDFSAWEDFRQINGDPEVPEVGKQYVMYRRIEKS